MPSSREDAVDVERHIGRIFGAGRDERASEIRALFVEALDFDADFGDVDLSTADKGAALPPSAERIAQSDGVNVVYVALEPPKSDSVGTRSDRVRKAEAAAAAKAIAEQLGGDLLLVFTNASASQLHFVYPSF